MIKGKKVVGVAVAVLMTLASSSSIYAAVSTDKKVYYNGDRIVISGTSSDAEVLLKVLGPNGNIVFFNQDKTSNGNYSDSFVIPANSQTGLYNVVAGNGANVDKSTFSLAPTSGIKLALDSTTFYKGYELYIKGNTDLNEVLIKILGSNGNVIYFNTVKSSNGIFNDKFTIPSTIPSGSYTIVAGNSNGNAYAQQKIDIVDIPQYVPSQQTTSTTADDNKPQESEIDKAADQALKDLGDKPDSKSVTTALNSLLNKGVTPAKVAEILDSVASKAQSLDKDALKAVADLVSSSATVTPKAGAVDTQALNDAVDALVKISKTEDELKGKADESALKDLKDSLALTVKLDESAGAKTDTTLDGAAVRKLQAAGLGLRVQGTDLVMQIPSDSVDSAALTSAKAVKISKATLTGDSAKAIEDKAAAADSAIKPLGNVYSLELSTVDSNGNDEKVLAFKKKVNVRLTLPQDAVNAVKDKRKVGVYCIKDDGTTEFKDGKLDGNSIEFATPHFSNYAVAEYDKSFDDVKDGLWSKDYVEVLAARHITSGVDKEGKNFAPTANVTRAEFAAFIVRALGIDTADYKGTFKDVTSDKWYAKEVEAAKAAGLVDGTGTDAFAPDAQITREQMAKMIVNAVELKTGKKLSDLAGAYTGKLTDLDKASSWATDYIKAANALEIVGGNPDGSYKPTDKAQRQQIAKVIVDMLTKAGLI